MSSGRTLQDYFYPPQKSRKYEKRIPWKKRFPGGKVKKRIGIMEIILPVSFLLIIPIRFPEFSFIELLLLRSPFGL